MRWLFIQGWAVKCHKQLSQGQVVAEFGPAKEHLSLCPTKYRCLSLLQPFWELVLSQAVPIATQSQQITVGFDSL